MSASVPPCVPSTRMCISDTPQHTPATPEPLFETAPIVPATCVPWKLDGLSPVPSPTSVGSASMPPPSPALVGSETKS
jgi:hypothetical protein